MVEAGGREFRFHSLDPPIGKNFTARIAEAGFAGVRNDNILVRVLWTGIFMIAQAVGITAREHLLDCADDILRQGIFVL